jgi:hypothetical protein
MMASTSTNDLNGTLAADRINGNGNDDTVTPTGTITGSIANVTAAATASTSADGNQLPDQNGEGNR